LVAAKEAAQVATSVDADRFVAGVCYADQGDPGSSWPVESAFSHDER